MRKLITIILILFCGSSFAQVYQLMPQYGYQANRMVFDSTLQIPTTCGVPTLKSVQFTTRRAAIAFDSCNNRFYQYNPKTLAWSVISGGGGSTDTTSLSNRINLKIDSLKRRRDSVFAYRNGSEVFQFKDSIGGGGSTPTLNQVLAAGNTATDKNMTLVDNDYGNAFAIDVNSQKPTMTIAGNYGISDGGSLYLLPVDLSENKYSAIEIINTNQGATTQQKVLLGTDSGTIYFPFNTNSNDTLATLNNLRNTKYDTSKVVIAKVHNATGTTLQRGEVVYLFGANGDVASVKRANNKDDSTSSKTFGIVRRDIASGDTGYITTQGQIEKLNLGSYTAGDILWLDSIDGGFTKVKPQAPYHAVFLGVVERANAGNGLAYVKPQNGVEVDEIHDILINNVVNNQILIYSDTLKVWKNRSVYTIVDTTSLSNRINQKLSITDTTSLQQKSLPAYSIMGNNTNIADNPTAIYYKDTSGIYTGSPVWSTSAPTGTTNHSYRWTRIGNMVTLNISLVYGTVSAVNNTNVTIPFPSDCPTPVKPAGMTAASNYLYQTNSYGSNTLTTTANLNTRGGLRSNSSNNGFEIFINFSPATIIWFQLTITYYTN